MFTTQSTHPDYTAMQLALMAVGLKDEDQPLKRPTVPGDDEQQLDTDYDPDPALEQTPVKNEKPRTSQVEDPPR